jgi:septum site-determining protein MinD
MTTHISAQPLVSAAVEPSGRIVVFFGAQRRIGKTIIVAKTGMSLVHAEKKSVCLVDLSPPSDGQLARVLNLTVSRTLAEHAPAMRRGTAEDVQRLAVSHNSGVDVIVAATQPRQTSQLDARLIGESLKQLAARYDYVLVDGGLAFSEWLMAACETAQLLVLVSTAAALTGPRTKWALSALEGLAFPETMIKLIISQTDESAAAGSGLAYEVVGTVPADNRAGLEMYHRVARALATAPRGQRRSPATPPTAAKPTPNGTPIRPVAPADRDETVVDEVAALKRRIQGQLLNLPEFKSPELARSLTEAQWADIREKAVRLVASLVARENSELLGAQIVREHLVREIVDETLGLGPLEDLLRDPDVTDILVNGHDRVYVERRGRLQLTTRQFVSVNHLQTVIERILAPLGRRVDESSPMVDARLPDGSRLNVVIAPLSMKGPVLSIRKFSLVRYTQQDLISFGTLTPAMAQFLQACVLARKNVMIAGGAGSGKTTLLNMLCGFIPEEQRIITIEEAAEFRLARRHWVSLESRPRNMEGRGQVTIRDLFRNALHMRPDRIIIGECRGAEVLDMLQAMNTGHDGSMTTIHANSPQDVVTRIDAMVLMADVELPMRAIREMILSGIHVIVHLMRLSDGSRKIMAITELVHGTQEGEVQLRDVFVFKQEGVAEDGHVLGDFACTGGRPSFWDELRAKGIPIDERMFEAPRS